MTSSCGPRAPVLARSAQRAAGRIRSLATWVARNRRCARGRMARSPGDQAVFPSSIYRFMLTHPLGQEPPRRIIMRGIWFIAFASLFATTACSQTLETGQVTGFGQSAPVSGGMVHSFVIVTLHDRTEVTAWLPDDDRLWRTLSNGAKSHAIRVKIQRKGNAWRFVEIVPPRKFKSGEISVAMLPLADMSPDRDQEGLCNRIADGIRNTLSQDNALRVVTRESSFVFKGTDSDISYIGRRLNVSYVLEGIVRTSGEQVRLVLQLTRVDSKSTVWSDAFNVQPQDVATVQHKVVPTIVDALKGDVLARER
jgi:TolB-like protein